MDLEAVRKLFPITEHRVFLNHAAVAPISRPAAQAICRYTQQSSEHAGIGAGFFRRIEQIRGLAGRLINASAREIAFVKNTTEGIGWVANGLAWEPGDNVVTTGSEFPANVYPWEALQDRGVQRKVVAEVDGQVATEQIIDAINNRTRVVAISAVQYANGFRCDLAALGRVCREKNVHLCVDAIQQLGAFPIDVQAMNIDFLSADSHKWLCGPEGCGVFYCRESLLTKLKPTITGWLCMKDALDFGKHRFEYVDDARRFDTGCYNIAGILGMGASIELLLSIGIKEIAERILLLTDHLTAGLSQRGYRVLSPRRPGEASGIVLFESDRHNHEQLRNRLEEEHRIVLALRNGRLRASPHFYNTIEEMDRLVDALSEH